MKKNLILFLGAMLMLAIGMSSCSSSDDNEGDSNSVNLYAIIKPEGAQLTDIVPSDYVLTLDNIIAVNPETGEFKVKDTERIDSNGSFLFDAKLNSSLSSYLLKGLTFCHYLSDKNGLARYDLGGTRIVSADGEVIEGNPTDQQKQGMQRMYQILQKAGKIRSHIDYDFQFE